MTAAHNLNLALIFTNEHGFQMQLLCAKIRGN